MPSWRTIRNGKKREEIQVRKSTPRSWDLQANGVGIWLFCPLEGEVMGAHFRNSYATTWTEILPRTIMRIDKNGFGNGLRRYETLTRRMYKMLWPTYQKCAQLLFKKNSFPFTRRPNGIQKTSGIGSRNAIPCKIILPRNGPRSASYTPFINPHVWPRVRKWISDTVKIFVEPVNKKGFQL